MTPGVDDVWAGPRTPLYLREVCDRLRGLGERPPTAETRAVVEEALRSKWEGVQVVAGRVLAGWGDEDAVELLYSWLARSLQKRYGWSVTGAAVEALAKLVGEEDADRVLALYFGTEGWSKRHSLLPLVRALPVEPARERLLAAGSSPDRESRQAAMAATGQMPFPDRRRLLERFLGDPDPEIRRNARLILNSRLMDEMFGSADA